MTNIVRDEISHAMRCSALLKVLGVSADTSGKRNQLPFLLHRR
ncbi:MAG: hypothetical protein V3U90_01500 [Dehalococcoidia bacterium]